MFYNQTPIYNTNNYRQQDLNISSGPGLYPSNNNYGQFSTGGNLHDTFRIDRFDNLYGGHTTIDLGDNQTIHLDW